MQKALKVFDNIVVLQGYNPSKLEAKDKSFLTAISRYGDRVTSGFFKGLLVDVAFTAVIRGLRNAHDLQYETNNQY